MLLGQIVRWYTYVQHSSKASSRWVFLTILKPLDWPNLPDWNCIFTLHTTVSSCTARVDSEIFSDIGKKRQKWIDKKNGCPEESLEESLKGTAKTSSIIGNLRRNKCDFHHGIFYSLKALKKMKVLILAIYTSSRFCHATLKIGHISVHLDKWHSLQPCPAPHIFCIDATDYISRQGYIVHVGTVNQENENCIQWIRCIQQLFEYGKHHSCSC